MRRRRSTATPPVPRSGHSSGSARADWETAGRYLSVPDDQLDRRAELAERLKAVLDRHHWFDLEAISPVSTGRLDDGLPAGVEEVGHIEVGDAGAVPLRMVRASRWEDRVLGVRAERRAPGRRLVQDARGALGH